MLYVLITFHEVQYNHVLCYVNKSSHYSIISLNISQCERVGEKVECELFQLSKMCLCVSGRQPHSNFSPTRSYDLHAQMLISWNDLLNWKSVFNICIFALYGKDKRLKLFISRI